MADPGMRKYTLSEVAGFRTTRDAFGAFHNPCAGFPILVEGIEIGSTEAYYQALRFPDAPDIQREILAQTIPIQSKRKAYEFLDRSRADWQQINVRLMKHALRLKLSQHREAITSLLEKSEGKPIVEISVRDDFWGAKPDPNGFAIGYNVLGRLWMEVREDLVRDPDAYRDGVPAPNFPNARIFGREIGLTPAPRPAQMGLGF